MRHAALVCLLMTLLSTMAMAQSVEGPGAVGFGQINVCPAGQTKPKPCNWTRKLTYSVTATTTFGKTMVVTQGAVNLDFTRIATTCKGTLPAGSSCTVSARFAPRAAGVRMGAVQLLDSSGNLLLTTLIHGQGAAPVTAFNPSVQTVRLGPESCNDSCYNAVAVDAVGDAFVEVNGDIVKVARNGVRTTVASGLPSVQGLAVDGAGNIFASSGRALVKVAAITGVQTTIAGFRYGVAVDGRGNLFVADYNLWEIHARTGITTIVLPQFIDGYQFLHDPWGVAVDGAGDVFVTDLDYTDVWEVPAGGLHGRFPIDAGQGGFAMGVAADAADDVFICDEIGAQVLEYQAGNSVTFLDGGEITFPNAAAVDGLGNLFLAQSDFESNSLVELKGSQPVTMDFGKVTVGTTSSPQSVTIQNVGSRPLNAVVPGLSISAGFVQVPGSGSPPDCDTSFALAPGAICNLSISFAPQAVGSATGTATFFDNALNTTPFATQTVNLKGRGIQ
jgi:hypothetical protein